MLSNFCFFNAIEESWTNVIVCTQSVHDNMLYMYIAKWLQELRKLTYSSPHVDNIG